MDEYEDDGMPVPREGGSVATNDTFKRNAGPDPVAVVGKFSMTRQEFAEECDINTIMARYETTGVLPANDPRPPVYVDFSEVPDNLIGYMELMQRSQTAFMSLPAKVRLEFENDPVAFVDFASDRENIDQLRSWGLAPPLPSVGEGLSPVGETSVPPPATPVGGSTQSST